jgi:biopolymer transport protein ExbD
MRASFVLTVALLFAAVASAAPIRPLRVADDPPLVGQTLSLTLNADGALVVPGRAPLTKAEELKSFLEVQIGRIKKAAEANKEEFSPALSLSANSQSAYARVLELLDLADQTGFRKITLKANKK